MTLLLAELIEKEVTAISAVPLSRSPTSPVQRPVPLSAPYFPSPTIYKSNVKPISSASFSNKSMQYP